MALFTHFVENSAQNFTQTLLVIVVKSMNYNESIVTVYGVFIENVLALPMIMKRMTIGDHRNEDDDT